jgi:hypothetical protein
MSKRRARLYSGAISSKTADNGLFGHIIGLSKLSIWHSSAKEIWLLGQLSKCRQPTAIFRYELSESILSSAG